MLAHSSTSINVAPMKQGNMLRHIAKTTSWPLMKGDMFMYKPIYVQRERAHAEKMLILDNSESELSTDRKQILRG